MMAEKAKMPRFKKRKSFIQCTATPNLRSPPKAMVFPIKLVHSTLSGNFKSKTSWL